MEKTYDEHLAEKTNEELFDILAHSEDYLPEAVESVRLEISKRNLNTAKVVELESRAQTTREEEEMLAQVPLQWPLRILMFLLSFGIPQVILGEFYRNKGYTRRYNECWMWMIYGLFFWVALFILLRILAT